MGAVPGIVGGTPAIMANHCAISRNILKHTFKSITMYFVQIGKDT